MKIFYISIFLFSFLYSMELSVKQIQHMVSKIHQKREGINMDKLKETKEPFVRLEEVNNTKTYVIPKKEVKKAENTNIHLSLHAIINDKAYINGDWRKVDDVISGFTLKYIGKRGVVFRRGNYIRTVFLNKKDNLKYITIE